MMVGNRMDTHIVLWIEAGPEAMLVLTSVTTRADGDRHPYRRRASPTSSTTSAEGAEGRAFGRRSGLPLSR
jgi:hypothetical protein